MPLSFHAFIKAAATTDDATGDFVADAKQDVFLPDATSWAELRDHLKGRRAGRPAIKTALDVWRAFEVARGQDS